jgi:signal transduction histidine kinase/ActR/RegA family two-component response regulator
MRWSITDSDRSTPRHGSGSGAVVALLAACLCAGPAAASGAAGELAALASAPTRRIVYGGDANFPPYEFLDEKGQPAGLNVDLIRAVCAAAGLEVEVELRPWSEIAGRIAGGKIDVAAMYRSARRAQEVDFAIPHELIYHEVLVRRGAAPVHSLFDLQGRKVLVEIGTYAEDAFVEMGLGEEIVRVASEPDAIRELAAGKGDAAVVTQTPGRPFERKLAGEVTPTGPPVLLAEYSFVARKGRRELIETINHGITEVKASGEFDRLYNHWVRQGRPSWLLRAVGLALAAALVVVLAGAIWNWQLHRRVAWQTAELRREFAGREKAQAALAEAERSLRQSQKMEVVGRLAGGIAHDFNNVLTVIFNCAESLREELAAQGRQTTDADEILLAAERAMRLTKQLLGFSRATPAKIEPLDLVQVLKELRGMIQRLVGEHIRVETNLAEGPVVAMADLVLVEQMVLNLAANARDAMRGGGRLTISIEARAAPAGHSPLPPGDYAAIVVADEGPGIPAAILDKIFDPFFTTKEPGEGTGLGLATVLANVTKLGGRVTAANGPGGGATFCLWLPLHDASAAPALRRSDPGEARLIGAGRTVLLVEDDDSLRRVARTALEHAGFRVVEAADGQEGLEVAAREPSIAAVVTDAVMPRRSGPQMVAELRARSPALPVLFVSGYVQEKDKLDLAQPHTGFLAKPYPARALVRALAEIAPAPAHATAGAQAAAHVQLA